MLACKIIKRHGALARVCLFSVCFGTCTCGKLLGVLLLTLSGLPVDANGRRTKKGAERLPENQY